MTGTRILVGDVREKLAELPDESVHCAVTSPPYWGLRDYGVAGQIGLEPSLGEHLAVMVDVFREVRRVLRKDGTLWLNYGDCYAAAPNGRSAADTKAAGNDDRTFRDKPFSTVGPVYAKDSNARGRASGKEAKWHNGEATAQGRICAGGYLKPKDLCMVSNRLAIALQEDGWWVRSEIIWEKPNPMPESAKDRPTTAHEKLWLLSKSEQYFYDVDSIRQQFADARQGCDGSRRESERNRGGRSDGFTKPNGIDPSANGGKNLRNVWEVATRPFDVEMCRSCRTVYSRAEYRALERYEDEDEKVHVVCRCGRDDEWLSHFATFPPALIEPCIKAGCPEGGSVLDPFGGAGTTGLVANRLGRDAILIELNTDYAEMARRRIEDDAPMFAKVEVEGRGGGMRVKRTNERGSATGEVGQLLAYLVNARCDRPKNVDQVVNFSLYYRHCELELLFVFLRCRQFLEYKFRFYCFVKDVGDVCCCLPPIPSQIGADEYEFGRCPAWDKAEFTNAGLENMELDLRERQEGGSKMGGGEIAGTLRLNGLQRFDSALEICLGCTELSDKCLGQIPGSLALLLLIELAAVLVVDARAKRKASKCSDNCQKTDRGIDPIKRSSVGRAPQKRYQSADGGTDSKDQPREQVTIAHLVTLRRTAPSRLAGSNSHWGVA